MKILVVRFRQMGDAVMSTPLLDSLRRTYPDAQIDFVLNERIAPLFEGHPSISNIITFSDSERKGFLRYLRKVRRVVREGRYDVVIDMRTTANTALFALFARRSALRIGLDKPICAGSTTVGCRNAGRCLWWSIICVSLRWYLQMTAGSPDG